MAISGYFNSNDTFGNYWGNLNNDTLNFSKFKIFHYKNLLIIILILIEQILISKFQ